MVLLVQMLSQAKVSNESPIGQALIGKKTGDTATVETPVGSYDVKILKVEKNRLINTKRNWLEDWFFFRFF